MKLRLIVLLLASVSLWGQSATKNIANTANHSSALPANAAVVPANNCGDAHMLMAWDRFARAGLPSHLLLKSVGYSFDTSLQKNFESAYNNCPDGKLACGDACCSSEEQCCVNSNTGGHYCAKKCD